MSDPVPERVLLAIRQMIVQDSLEPGSALPSQRELAQRLGVSRPSVREALSSLAATGEVEVLPGRGAYVQLPAPERSQPLDWPFTPADIFQVRYALEGFAAGLAAVTLGVEQLDALKHNVQSMRGRLACGDSEAAAQLDFEFHRVLVAASGNAALLAMLGNSAQLFFESQKLPFVRADRAMETWREHVRILKALERRSAPAAQKAMQEHLRNAAWRTGIAFAAP